MLLRTSPSRSCRRRPHRYDRVEKAAIYARNGVCEYWLVDPRGHQVTALVLDGEQYGEPRVYGDDETVLSVAVPGLRVVLLDLFR